MISEKELQAERSTGLGGSDIGAMYSLGYGCVRALMYEKRGTPVDYPKEETGPMERGKLLEPVAVELYRRRTGRSVDCGPAPIRRKDAPWMLVHPDGIITETCGRGPIEATSSATKNLFDASSPRPRGPGILETKVLGPWSFRRQKREGLSEEYILQLQHAMAVTGWTWGSFGILCLEPWDFLWFDINRDDELIARLIEDEAEFWSKVQNGPWVEKLDPKDPRCGKCPWRRTCQGEILFEAPPADERLELPRDESLLEKVRELDQRKQLVKEAEELEAEASEDLKAALGDRPGAIMPGYRVYFREYSETRLDTAGINAQAKKDPLFRSLIEKFKKTSVRRPLRVYATGD